jgi:choline dehydrogenase
MSQRRADVVIVGAGGAGCVLARRLGDRDDRDILLLEAGPDPGRAETAQLTNGWRLPTLPDWGYASDAAEPRPLRRGRALGGTSWFTPVRGARRGR